MGTETDLRILSFRFLNRSLSLFPLSLSIHRNDLSRVPRDRVHFLRWGAGWFGRDAGRGVWYNTRMRIVVKVGSHVIVNKAGRPNPATLRRLVAQLSALKEAGHELVFVSSGAVAAGIESLGFKERPRDVNDCQMCAAVGQVRFICAYEKLFGAHGVKIGQVLLTHADFETRHRSQNVKKSLEHLVQAGVLPVVNENDVVADEEMKELFTFGDNDWLSYLIARLLHADALVLLTSVDGLLDANGKRIAHVANFREAAKLVHPGEKGKLSKGGMDSKLKAVKAAVSAGIDTYVANGRKSVLVPLLAGKSVGTFFPASSL